MKRPAYPKYKPSGIEWLGEVPDHWQPQEVKFCYSIQLGKMLQPEAIDEQDEELPYLKSQHVQWQYVRVTDLPTMWGNKRERLKYVVSDGDLLVCEGGDVGRAGIVWNTPKGAIIQNALHRVRPLEKNDPRMLLYVLIHAASQGWFEILCNKATIAHFTGEKFGALGIALPPDDEQRSIAEYLDRETAKIDALVAKKRELIEKLKEKRTVLISRTVTRGLPPDVARAAGLDPNPKLKPSGAVWLGDISATWTTNPIKFLVSTPVTDGPHETPEILNDGIPFVSAEAINGGRINFDRIRGYISDADHKKYSKKYKPMLGDIYMVKSGATTGRIAMVETDIEFNIWSPLAAIRCNPWIANRNFVYFYMQSKEFQTAVELSWSYGTQQNIGMGVIQNLIVPLPSLDEQRRIAEFLRSETTNLDSMVEKVKAAIERLQEYRTALITAAVIGKIDVREAAA
jgi:type I restriction enzyme, S subunit